MELRKLTEWCAWLAIGAATAGVAAGVTDAVNEPASPPIHEDLILVAFKNGQRIRAAQGRLTDFDTGSLKSTDEFLSQHPGCTWKCVHHVDERLLDQYRRNAEANLGRNLQDLNLQFHVHLEPGLSVSEALEKFGAMDNVEYALAVPMPLPPPVAPDFTGQQFYNFTAPGGTGAFPAFSHIGCSTTGAGVRFGDIEYSWNFNHQDLPTMTLLGGTPFDAFNDPEHGTAVVGMVASRNDGFGTTGGAYDATVYVHPAQIQGQNYSIPTAITNMMTVLRAGDVLLIEQQWPGPLSGQLVPVEWDQANYDAIVQAVGNGIIVIEPAGNGGNNLDGPEFSTGHNGHYPFLAPNDSGAIINGAGSSLGAELERLSFSTYGSRVNVQGHGNNVTTTGYGGLYSTEGQNFFYTAGFSGTSSAGGAVAAAAVAIQSSYRAENAGAVLTPAQMRSLLISTGTPQRGNLAEHIGPRPNIIGAIENFCSVFSDCNANGVADSRDIRIGTSTDCNANGLPDDCETLPDCNGNSTPDVCEAFADCNENNVPDECDIASGSSTDTNSNGVPDECDPTFVGLFDDFPTSTINAANWASFSNAASNTGGANEPSPTRSLELRANGQIVSQFIDASRAAGNVIVNYAWQRTGATLANSPENGEDLFVEYWSNANRWVLIARHPGAGSDTAPYAAQLYNLPANASHLNFRLRFRMTGNSSNDRFYVDDIGVSENASIQGGTLLAPADAPPCACPVDRDCNQVVEIADFFVFLSDWFSENGDFDGDGAGNAADLFAFIQAWFGVLNNHGVCP